MFQPVSSVDSVTNPSVSSGPASGPYFNEHEAAVAFTKEAGNRFNKLADVYEMADPTGVSSVARNAMENNGAGTMLAMGALLIPGGSKEIRVANETFEQARNAGLKAIGELGSAARTEIVRKQGGLSGLATGFSARVGGVFKAFRIDFAPKKGAHINMTG